MRSPALLGLCLLSIGTVAPSALAAPPEGKADERGAEQKKAADAEADAPRPTHEIVWLNAEGGVEAINLETFNADADRLTAGFVPARALGPMVGVGAGLRIVFLTLGARARYATFANDRPGSGGDSWRTWSLDGEVGVRVPLGRFEPYFTLAGGYTELGGVGTAVPGLPDGLLVHGANARLGAGFDYYVTPVLSVGAGLQGELLALTRPGVSLGDLAAAKDVATLDEAKAKVLEANQASVAAAFALTGGMGVHF